MEALLNKLKELFNGFVAQDFASLNQQAAELQHIDWQALHFLRPDWFYGFIPLLLLLLMLLRKNHNNQSWQKVCDPQLLPYVLTSKQGKRSYLTLIISFIAVSLCLTALAGPVYKKLPQPVFREQSALVILLDLSQSMNATDIKPSRIERAKLELLDILKQRHGGQTALIVYAADAFTVTPLTDDNATIANLVPSLETSMMPAQGSNLANALEKAGKLLKQSGINRGDILVITDDIHQSESDDIRHTAAAGHRISIFAIGTTEGGPIPLSNGFLQDSNGAIVIPRLEIQKLQKMALAGHGLYVSIDAGDHDTNALSKLFNTSRLTENIADTDKNKSNDLTADIWQEEGPWLILPVMLLASLWARRGWLLAIVLSAVVSLLLPQPGYAQTPADQTNTADSKNTGSTSGFSLNNLTDMSQLWLTADQQAMQAFNKGNTEAAARKFTNPDWKASALYRNGNFEQAAELFNREPENTDTTADKTSPAKNSDRFYNRGNALAKAGKYQQALSAYEKAIELDKNNDDAIYNRDLVKKALEQQQQNKNEKSDKDSKENSKEDSQKESDKSSDENSDQQSKQNAEQQSGKPSDQQSDKQADKQSEQNQQQSDPQQDQQKNDSQENEESDKDKSSSDKKEQGEDQDKDQDEALKQRHPDDTDSQKDEQDQKNMEQDSADKEKQDKQDENEAQGESGQDQDNQQEKNNKPPKTQEINPAEASISEDEKATEQWLRRIQDDPGGLLRRKFLYQYKQIPNQRNSDQPW